MPDTSPEQERQAITSIEDRIQAAFGRGDAAGVAAEYTEDAMLMPPFRPPVVGRAGVEANYQGLFQQFDSELSTEVEEVEIAGDWAFMRGTFRQQLTPKGGGQAIPAEGKYLAVVRRQADGSWKFHRDMFNGSSPPALPGAGTLLSLGLKQLWNQLFGGKGGG